MPTSNSSSAENSSPSKALRIVFAGTPEFAAVHLQAIVEHSQHQVIAVYTQPDRKAGRGKKLLASPVKQTASAYNIPVLQPVSLKDDAAATELASLQVDIMVVAAYGLILPERILQTPTLGCINVHASLLPHWRGAAPIERAILAGDERTGITIMQMDSGLDTGDMLMTSECEIEESETGDSLRHKLQELGAALLLEALDSAAKHTLKPVSQDDKLSSYAGKLLKTESVIDWQQPAQVVDRQIRALYSALNCYSLLNGQRLRVLAATPVELSTKLSTEHAKDSPNDKNVRTQPGKILKVSTEGILVSCAEHALLLTRIQLPGAKAISVRDFINGKPDYFQVGEQFANPEDNRD